MRYTAILFECGSEPIAAKITDTFILAVSVERVHTTQGGGDQRSISIALVSLTTPSPKRDTVNRKAGHAVRKQK